MQNVWFNPLNMKTVVGLPQGNNMAKCLVQCVENEAPTLGWLCCCYAMVHICEADFGVSILFSTLLSLDFPVWVFTQGKVVTVASTGVGW